MNEAQLSAISDVLNDARDQANIVRRRRIVRVPGGILVVVLAVDR